MNQFHKRINKKNSGRETKMSEKITLKKQLLFRSFQIPVHLQIFYLDLLN